MHLKALFLKNFRAYDEALFEFSPEINLITGSNAIGKTTLLEAVYLLMTGRSFRTTQIADLIKKGEKQLHLEATFMKHGVGQTLRFSFNGKERKVQHNQTEYPSITGLIGILQGVVTTPDDAKLVKGAPGERRRYLDLQLAQIDPLYVHHLARYYRAMRQRNHLLRTKNLTTIESWEHEMANAGAYLIQQRQRAIVDLQNRARKLHFELTGETHELVLHYKTLSSEAGQILEQFRRMRKREMELGSSQIGPHRDDFMIAIGKKDVRHFASEGQQRSCVTVLRFAEWNRLNEVSDVTPMMLIDDVGMSLDDNRRQRLQNEIDKLGQVYLTTTHNLFRNEGRRHIAKLVLE